MLMRTDPLGEFDRFFSQFFTPSATGGATRTAGMPIDAWREGDAFFLELDLPGVDQDSIDIDIDRNVLTVRARRQALPAKDALVTERHHGAFSRQFILGDMLDLDAVRAGYDNGVLTLRVPIAERAKPRKVAVETASGPTTVEAVGSSDDRELAGSAG
jgi:HSP20 family protein